MRHRLFEDIVVSCLSAVGVGIRFATAERDVDDFCHVVRHRLVIGSGDAAKVHVGRSVKYQLLDSAAGSARDGLAVQVPFDLAGSVAIVAAGRTGLHYRSIDGSKTFGRSECLQIGNRRADIAFRDNADYSVGGGWRGAGVIDRGELRRAMRRGDWRCIGAGLGLQTCRGFGIGYPAMMGVGNRHVLQTQHRTHDPP